MVSKLPTLQFDNNYNHPEELIVSLEGIDKVWSFKSRITVPISHIQSVEVVDPKTFHHARLVKVSGAGVGHYKVGTFLECKRGEKNKLVFYDVHHSNEGINGKLIIITLNDEHYSKLVLEVDDDVSEKVLQAL
jgi:hypothetical protein